jgi:hypothetical protein
MKKIIAFLLLFAFGLSGCEKDDICDANTPTTPRLVISFYEIADPTLPKNVKNLKVIGKDEKNGIVFNAAGDSITSYQTNANTISIPLKVNAKTVTYSFILNDHDPNPAVINTDNLTFNYTTNNIYVSRACGFKTNFTLDPVSIIEPVTTPFVLTDPDANRWIQLVKVKKRNIEFENETHIEISF